MIIREKEYDKWLVTGTINFLIAIVKWLFLVMAVILSGFTIGLLVATIAKAGNVTNNTLGFFMNIIAGIPQSTIDEVVLNHGVAKVITSGIGFGFAQALTYTLGYAIIYRFQVLFSTIKSGNMFTTGTVKLINDTLPYTVIYALAQPVIVFVIYSITKVIDESYVNIGGLIFIFVGYTLKLIFEAGLDLAKSSKKYEKSSSDMKAKEEELDVELIKKDNQIKELKENIKELKNELEAKSVKSAPKAKTDKKTTTTRKTTKK